MWPKRPFGGRNKFMNTSCRCSEGHQHDSRLEAGYCTQLHLLKANGYIKDIKIQHQFSFDVNGVHIANYYADFLVTNNDGNTEVHETKGFKTDVYTMKKKLFKALYEIPLIEIRGDSHGRFNRVGA